MIAARSSWRSPFLRAPVVLIALAAAVPAGAALGQSPAPSLDAQVPPPAWRMEWPDTAFEFARVDFAEIVSGGVPKDGIPAIDAPVFHDALSERGLNPDEPVITLVHDGRARAYPLRYLMWHEIVNDTLGDLEVAVTYCPLCDSGVAFRRRLVDGPGEALTFGVTGLLRKSDLIMYDRQTESWWQQFTGDAIVGSHAAADGTRLVPVPITTESWQAFLDRAGTVGEMDVLTADPRFLRPYGMNPYLRYDSSDKPLLHSDPVDFAALAEIGVKPLDHVAVLRDDGWEASHAWPLAWTPPRSGEPVRISVEGTALSIRRHDRYRSVLDTQRIGDGRIIDTVEFTGDDGRTVRHHLGFAFAFCALEPAGVWHFPDGRRKVACGSKVAGN